MSFCNISHVTVIVASESEIRSCISQEALDEIFRDNIWSSNWGTLNMSWAYGYELKWISIIFKVIPGCKFGKGFASGIVS